MKTDSRTVGALLLLFTTFSWASLLHVAKSVLAHVDPFWFTLARYVAAAIVLVALATVTTPLRWRLLRPDLGRLAFHGFGGYGVFGIGTLLGLRWTSPSHGAVIVATMPITTVAVRSVLDRRMPPPATWAVAILALAGALVVSSTGAEHEAAGSWRGDAIVFLSSFGWIAYTMGPSALPHLDAREYSVFSLVVALPGLALAVALATAAGIAHAPPAGQWAAIAPQLAYVVAIPTVAAVLAFNRGVRALGPVDAMLFINVVPVSALAISAALGRMPTAPEVAGSALVIAAVAVQNRMAARSAASAFAERR